MCECYHGDWGQLTNQKHPETIDWQKVPAGWGFAGSRAVPSPAAHAHEFSCCSDLDEDSVGAFLKHGPIR